MKERPILFSGPMVRAILEGRKTQTRRLVKADWIQSDRAPLEVAPGFFHFWCSGEHACPLGEPGDLLWVRETHYLVRQQGKQDGAVIEIDYKADPNHEQRMCPQKWRPSIHMPRWASRITLEITGVRVERLQDISEADAVAEGIEFDPGEGGVFHVSRVAGGCWSDSAVGSFGKLWKSINGDDSWDANPWVWVVEFKRSDA